MLTSLAVVLLAVLAILQTQGQVTPTLALVIGIVALVLALIDLLRPYVGRVP